MSTSREAFEAWVMRTPCFTKDVTIDGGMYWASDVEGAWRAWQAAMQYAYADAAEVCKAAAARNTAGADSTDDADDARCMRSAAWKLTICANVFEDRAKEVSE